MPVDHPKRRSSQCTRPCDEVKRTGLLARTPEFSQNLLCRRIRFSLRASETTATSFAKVRERCQADLSVGSSTLDEITQEILEQLARSVPTSKLSSRRRETRNRCLTQTLYCATEQASDLLMPFLGRREKPPLNRARHESRQTFLTSKLGRVQRCPLLGGIASRPKFPTFYGAPQLRSCHANERYGETV